MKSQLTITTCRGAEVRPHLDDVARLRIEVFRAYPYLYEGDTEYETRYLRTYSASPESLFVLARDGARIVGASTGVPMSHEEADFKRPFIEHGRDPERIFYFGESVLLPAYRGLGVGGRFFEERERHARSLGRFEWTAFCAVARDGADPRRPADYQPLDRFWTRRGYRKVPALRATYSWKELGDEVESMHVMEFWMKRLEVMS